MEKEIKLTLPKNKYRNYLLISSSATSDAIIVSGSAPYTSDLKGEQPYSTATIIDPNTLNIRSQIPLGPSTEISKILPYNHQFYLLNAGNKYQIKGKSNDIIVLDSKKLNITKRLTTAPLPIWGIIRGDILYAYHNLDQRGLKVKDKRYISRLNLTTGEKFIWSIPDGWNSDDLNIVHGKIILTRWLGKTHDYLKWLVSGNPEDGIYEFDPNTKQLKQLLQVADASKFIVPPVSQ